MYKHIYVPILLTGDAIDDRRFYTRNKILEYGWLLIEHLI
jgi:hypothetical protein